MAFTQARAIALINTALSFHSALIKARNYAAALQTDLAIGTIDAEYAFHTLSFYLSESNTELFHDFPTMIATLVTEHAHFSRNARRNAAEAERARRRREASGERRPYIQHTMPYETDRIAPITYRPPGMNSRGDLPKASSTPTAQEELSPEEFDRVIAEYGVYKPSSPASSEPRVIKTNEEAAPPTHDDTYEPSKEEWK